MRTDRAEFVELEPVSSEQRLQGSPVLSDRCAVGFGLLSGTHSIEYGFDYAKHSANLVPVGPVNAGVELLDVRAPFAADAWRVVKGGYEALGLEWDPASSGAVEDEVPGIELEDVEASILRRLSLDYQVEPVALSPATLTAAEAAAGHFRSPLP